MPELLVGDAKTLDGLGVIGVKAGWSTHSGGGTHITVAGGVLTAPPAANFYFFDSYSETCVMGGKPAQFSAHFQFGAPTSGGAVIPDDFDTTVERLDITCKWLTEFLFLAGPGTSEPFSPTYHPGLDGIDVVWDIPASPANTKYLQLQLDINGGLGSHFSFFMTNPSFKGLSCMPPDLSAALFAGARPETGLTTSAFIPGGA